MRSPAAYGALIAAGAGAAVLLALKVSPVPATGSDDSSDQPALAPVHVEHSLRRSRSGDPGRAAPGTATVRRPGRNRYPRQTRNPPLLDRPQW
jgi:hypothetical protein